MSKIEIAIIVILCVIPIVPILMLIPKRKAKKNKAEVKAEEKSSKPAEEKKEEISKEPPKEQTKSDRSFNEIGEKDFESYMDFKKRNIKGPAKDMPKNDFVDNSMSFEQYLRNENRSVEQEKNIADQINSLDPTIKAMIIAGILDKKNYD